MAVRDQIVAMLQNDAGDVARIASDLSVSISYVNRIRKELGLVNTGDAPQETSLVPLEDLPPRVTPQQLIGSFIPPNVKSVEELRNLTLGEIKNRIEKGEITPKDLNMTLRTLLHYEVELHRLVSPSLSSMGGQHNTFNILIQKLESADPAMLRGLAGLPAREIVEGEFLQDA